MNSDLFKAILAMDSYNRGYKQAINLNGADSADSIGDNLGNAIVIQESDIADGSAGVNSNFYALAYDYKGQRIISYRGTDQPPKISDAISLGDLAGLFTFPGFALTNIAATLVNNAHTILTPDVWNGWFVGAGKEESAQAVLAFEFYKDMVGGHDNVYSANVTLTGHSLGGGAGPHNSYIH